MEQLNGKLSQGKMKAVLNSVEGDVRVQFSPVGGTTNYEDLANKPSINGVPLIGDTPLKKDRQTGFCYDAGY